MVKWLLCLFLLSGVGRSSKVTDFLDERVKILRENGFFFPDKISVVKKIKGSKKAEGVQWRMYEQLSGVKVMPGNILNWSWLMNGYHHQEYSKSEKTRKILNLTNSNLLILAKKKKWEMLLDKEGEIHALGQDIKPKSINRASVHSWLSKALGYNAMVVFQKNSQYYIKSFDTMNVGDQGLIFKNSHESMKIENPQIFGIVEIVKIEGLYGIGKLVLGDRQQLAGGSKLKIIRKKPGEVMAVEE